MSGDICYHLLTDDLNEALFDKIKEEHSECVNMLLQKGADVNKTDGKRDTLLAKAADVGNVDILKHLIVSGANVNTLGYFHLRPLSRGFFTKVMNSLFAPYS